MKLPEKILKTADVGYLYSNGKLVIAHRAPHKQAGSVEWVTIHDASGIRCAFVGRIVLHNRGAIRMLTVANCVKAQPPALELGSPNTKKLGIPYGYVSFALGADQYKDVVTFPVFERLVSGDFAVQPDIIWREPENPGRWGEYPVYPIAV